MCGTFVQQVIGATGNKTREIYMHTTGIIISLLALTSCSSALANEKPEVNIEDYIIVTADGGRSVRIMSTIYSGKVPDFDVPYELKVSLSEDDLKLNNLNLNFGGVDINYDISVLPEPVSVDLNTFDFSLISMGKINDGYIGVFLVEFKFGSPVKECFLRDQYSGKPRDSRPYMALHPYLDGSLGWIKYELNEDCHYVVTASDLLIEE